jgi:hypothetical protein
MRLARLLARLKRAFELVRGKWVAIMKPPAFVCDLPLIGTIEVARTELVLASRPNDPNDQGVDNQKSIKMVLLAQPNLPGMFREGTTINLSI